MVPNPGIRNSEGPPVKVESNKPHITKTMLKNYGNISEELTKITYNF